MGEAYTDGVLVVERAPAALLCQQRVFLYLDAPTLVVGQVPVKFVYLIHGEHIEQLFHLVGREEVARAVEVHPSPSEAGLVGNGALGQEPAVVCLHLAFLDIGG